MLYSFYQPLPGLETPPELPPDEEPLLLPELLPDDDGVEGV
jgi:hypothetical protein